MIDYYEPKLDLTLLGCGFLGPYHLGAICLLEQIWPQKPYNRICGASCGGLVGALLVSGLKLDYVLQVSVAILRQLRAWFKRLISLPNNWNNASTLGTPKIANKNATEPFRRTLLSNSTLGRNSSNSKGLDLQPSSADMSRLGLHGGDTAARCFAKRKPQLELKKEARGGHVFLPVGQLVEQMLERMLPEDAHLKCSGRLGLSLTRATWPLENKFVSQFESRRELIQATCAGCFIPLWSGSWRTPVFRNDYYLDGAYSDNQPKFECDNDASFGQIGHQNSGAPILGKHIHQVSLSPFCCTVDVGPRDEGSRKLFSGNVAGTNYVCNWRNIVRCWHAMLPSRLDNYKQYLVGGHSEMKEYLFRNDMIKCRKCYDQLQLQTHINAPNINHGQETSYKRNQLPCMFCLKLLEQVDSLRIPDEVLRLLEE